jgi:3-oxoacyl-[acyl-carrier protein] reductase
MGALDGKVIALTGGAGKLGSACAIGLAKEGAKLLINDINPTALKAALAAVEAAGGRAIGNGDDVLSWSGAGRAIDACVEAFGRIDGLVNCAHRYRHGAIWEMDEEAIDITSSAHVKGHFATAHHAARHMRKRRSGSILTLTSVALHGIPGRSPYAAVKGAIVSATWSWALELAEYGVRVNSVSPVFQLRPGANKPTMHVRWRYAFDAKDTSPPGFDMPTAETNVPIVVYLLSDESRWVSGQVIFLSGDTLAVMQQPQYRFAFQPQGWSFVDLKLRFRDTVGAELSPPGLGAPAYQWYNGVGT